MPHPSNFAANRAWDLAHRVVRDSLAERGAKLVALTREGSHGAQASVRLREGSYVMLHARVPPEVADRVAIDGALAFLLVRAGAEYSPPVGGS